MKDVVESMTDRRVEGGLDGIELVDFECDTNTSCIVYF